MYVRVQLEGVEGPLFFGIAVQTSLRAECLLAGRPKVWWKAQGPVLEGRAVALLVAGHWLAVLAPADVLAGSSSSSSSGGRGGASAEGGAAGAALSVSSGSLGGARAGAEVVDEEEASDGDASDGEGEDLGRIYMHLGTACAAATARGRTPGHAGVLGAARAVLAVVRAGAVDRWEPEQRLLPGLPHSIREPSSAATSAHSSLLVQRLLQGAWPNCRVTISTMEAVGPSIVVQGVEGGGAAQGWSGEQLLRLSHGLQPEQLQPVYGHLGQLAGAIGAVGSPAGAVLLARGASGQVSHQELAGAAFELQQQLDLVGQPQRQPPLERKAQAWPHGMASQASKRARMLEVLLGVGPAGAGGAGAAGKLARPDDTVTVRVGTGHVNLQRKFGGHRRPMLRLDYMLNSSSGGDLVALVDGNEVLLVPAYRLSFTQPCIGPAEARQLAVPPAQLAPASLRPGAQLGLASAAKLVWDIVRNARALALAHDGCSFADAGALGRSPRSEPLAPRPARSPRAPMPMRGVGGWRDCTAAQRPHPSAQHPQRIDGGVQAPPGPSRPACATQPNCATPSPLSETHTAARGQPEASTWPWEPPRPLRATRWCRR